MTSEALSETQIFLGRMPPRLPHCAVCYIHSQLHATYVHSHLHSVHLPLPSLDPPLYSHAQKGHGLWNDEQLYVSVQKRGTTELMKNICVVPPVDNTAMYAATCLCRNCFKYSVFCMLPPATSQYKNVPMLFTY